MPGDWRQGFDYAWQQPDPKLDEGPGLTWRQLAPRHWSGTWQSKIRGTVTRDGDGWVAYVRLEDPPGLSPITTIGRYATVEAAQVDETVPGCTGSQGTVRSFVATQYPPSAYGSGGRFRVLPLPLPADHLEPARGDCE